jgi:hypothetical protein
VYSPPPLLFTKSNLKMDIVRRLHSWSNSSASPQLPLPQAQLCRRCKRIRWDKITISRYSSWAPLFTTKDLQKQHPDCDLCYLIHSMLSAHLKARSRYSSHLLNKGFRHIQPQCGLYQSGNDLRLVLFSLEKSPLDYINRAEYENNTNILPGRKRVSWEHGYISIQDSVETPLKGDHFQVCPVSSRALNFSLLRDLLQGCRKSHAKCIPQELPLIPGFSLIDCHSRSIVAALEMAHQFPNSSP